MCVKDLSTKLINLKLFFEGRKNPGMKSKSTLGKQTLHLASGQLRRLVIGSFSGPMRQQYKNCYLVRMEATFNAALRSNL